MKKALCIFLLINFAGIFQSFAQSYTIDDKGFIKNWNQRFNFDISYDYDFDLKESSEKHEIKCGIIIQMDNEYNPEISSSSLIIFNGAEKRIYKIYSCQKNEHNYCIWATNKEDKITITAWLEFNSNYTTTNFCFRRNDNNTGKCFIYK